VDGLRAHGGFRRTIKVPHRKLGCLAWPKSTSATSATELWRGVRRLAVERLRCHGTSAGRWIGGDVLGRAERAVSGLDLFRRRRGAEAALAARLMHFEKIGSFGLTEPWPAPPRVAECSRPAAGREDDVLVLDGQRKCIGTATFADIAVIWAREE